MSLDCYYEIQSRFTLSKSIRDLLRNDGEMIVYSSSGRRVREHFHDALNFLRLHFDVEVCYATMTLKTKNKLIRFKSGDIGSLRGYKTGTKAIIEQ